MSLINCYTDDEGCIVCPDIPPTPGTPGQVVYTPIFGWNAGANSVEELDGDVILSFTMPLASLGAICGFRHGRTGVGIPELITHGLVFQHSVLGINLYGIVENGTTVMSGISRAPGLDELFYIERRNGVVTYYGNDPEPIYSSTVPSSGSLIVGACLFASGDDIGDSTYPTFDTLDPFGAYVTGTVSAATERATMIATNISGNLCIANFEKFRETALGSAVYIAGSLGVFSSLITDIEGALMISDAPEFGSAFSQYVVPPVYVVSASFNPITMTASGYSITTGNLSFAIPRLTLLATNISGALMISNAEKFTSPYTGDAPPINNYFTMLQDPGYLDIAQATQSPWAIIQENLVGDTSLRADVGVSLVARAMATDGVLSRANFHKLAGARATVYAQLNQAWYGVIDADATANLTLTEQVHYLASVFARCAATATPTSIAELHLALTASVIALAGASGKVVYPLVANATADVDTNVVYGAVGRILANLTASISASRHAVFLVAAEAETLASAGAGATAAQFAAAIATAGAYVRVTFDGNDFEGWVLNTRPKGDDQIRGFTTYQDFPFTSFANFNGKQYGASTEGIFELVGDTDDGDPIPAWVRTALFDLESRRDKRMQTMYVGYTSDKRLVAKMITTTGGEKVETWYTMRAIQKADANREARIEVGKGLHSVYWGFELHNEDGADFSLDVVALWPVYLDRRVTNG